MARAEDLVVAATLDVPAPANAVAVKGAVSPPAAVGWTAVAVLLTFSLFSVLDRQIIALLVQPIKADLSLSDTQLRLLQGLAFSIFYSLAGLPIGYLVDRYPRRIILYVGMTVWSLSAAACGLARGFTQLFIGRMAVGVGEACLAPSAVSLISDLFPANRVATPMGVYGAGYFLGSGLALGIGGLVVGLFAGRDSIVLPVVGAVASWQAVFLVTGLPGLAVAPLAFVIYDPRRFAVPVAAGGEPAMSFTGLFRDRGGLLIRCFVAFSMASLLSYAVTSWTPAFLARRFGLLPQQIGWSFGLAIAVSGAIGALGGGMLLDRIYRSGRTDAYMLVPAVAALLALPPMTMAYFMQSPAAVLSMLAIGMCAIGTTAAASYSTWRKIAPPELRGRVTAMFVLFTGLIGGGLGPLTVALISDYLLKDEARIGEAVAIVVAVVLPLMSVLFLSNRRAMRAIREG